MKMKRILMALTASLLLIGSAPAFAETPAERATLAAEISAKYMPIFDAQYARIIAMEKRAKLDPGVWVGYEALLKDFNQVRFVIESGLASSTSILEDVRAYAEEETGEFVSSIPLLEKDVAAIKTISCVKGKVTKKVTAKNAKCPKGYKKK